MAGTFWEQVDEEPASNNTLIRLATRGHQLVHETKGRSSRTGNRTEEHTKIKAQFLLFAAGMLEFPHCATQQPILFYKPGHVPEELH